MRSDSNGRLQFGAYEFDFQARKLFRDAWPVKLQPQPLRVVSVLIERRGEIVSREQLRTTIWGDTTFVEFDQGLNYCIRQIRVALRDDASQPNYIETLPKQGYRFIADVTLPSNGATAHANSAAVAATEPGVATKEVETARQSEAVTIPSAPPPQRSAIPNSPISLTPPPPLPYRRMVICWPLSAAIAIFLLQTRST